MDLRRLQYFLVVAEELSFTRAAARLHISQPPLSQMIARMEQELGFKLFVRTKRKVALTEGGKLLVTDSRVVLKYTEEAIVRARRAANGETGHLRIAFIPWGDITTVFSEIFRHLRDVAPDVIVDFYSMPSLAAAQALEEGRIDIAFMTQPIQPLAGVEIEPVLVDELVAALPKGHELCNRKVIPLRRLSKARHMIDHPQTTLALVAAGVGISVVASSYQTVERPGVVFRKIKPTGQIKLIVAWKSTNHAPVVETFLRTMYQVLGRTKFRKRSRRR
jgi:DNA-binding transcriptional LysR family regulator